VVFHPGDDALFDQQVFQMERAVQRLEGSVIVIDPENAVAVFNNGFVNCNRDFEPARGARANCGGEFGCSCGGFTVPFGKLLNCE
jgi:hypothetical protein